MRDINEVNEQYSDATAERPTAESTGDQAPLVGLERATELNTAGVFAVVPVPRSRRVGDMIFGGSVRAAVWLFMLVLAGIVVVLVVQALPSIQSMGLDFYFGSRWDPVNDVYSAGPMILGTVIVAAVSIVIAGVVGLAAALYLVEYAPRWLREPVGFLIELLAYIPSVVYGLFGLLVVAPWLQQSIQPWLSDTFGFLPIFNGAPYGVGIMAAILILSIMLVPLIVSLSREALLLVPDSQREAMMALGSTRWEMLRHAVIPYARGAIFGAIILSLGRALGETIAVAMTIGGAHRIPQSLFDQGYTLSSVIANEFNEASTDLYLSALINAGLTLFVLTTVVNVGAYFILRRINRNRVAA